jgi:hypothetical protein
MLTFFFKVIVQPMGLQKSDLFFPLGAAGKLCVNALYIKKREKSVKV